MAWRVEFHKAAQEELSKLDQPVRERILRFLADQLEGCSDPRFVGESLEGEVLDRVWKYCVADYQIICNPEDNLLLVHVIRIGNRREVYR